jgi:DNA (cytosine-5)-methyltransferase 1
MFATKEIVVSNYEDNLFVQAKSALAHWSASDMNSQKAKYQVIDLFSGCGGMSLGFAALSKVTNDIKLVGAADVNKTSLDTYRNNFNAPAIIQDVFEIARYPDALDKFLDQLPNFESKLPLILIGCAPCQGFTAHRKKNWNTPDERNGLVEAFTDLAVIMQPECVIMENVPELLSHKYWHHFSYFKKKLEENGYIVKQNIHNSAEHGVPQERFRAIVVAMKKNFFMLDGRYTRGEFLTVRDAIGNLPLVAAGEVCSSDPMHKSARHKQSTIDVIKAVPLNGGSRPKGVGPKCLQDFKGFADVYGRLSWDKPAITITHYARNPASGRFVHPEQHRGLSMREAARLQSFPDGFKFCGKSDDVYRQIGEAVPPMLATAIAANVYANLTGNIQPRPEYLVEEPVSNSFASVISGLKSAKHDK